ncbi:biotin/lipoyl-containing protein, partial [Agrobacterium tumefaciens]
GTAVRFEDGAALTVDTGWLPGQSLGLFTVAGEVIAAKVDLAGAAIRLRWRGMDIRAHVRSPRVAALSTLMPKKMPPDTSRMVLCPMPGVITSVAVKQGETVEAGQALAVVEAMKMENILRAERRATVKRVAVTAGTSLSVDEVIMELE